MREIKFRVWDTKGKDMLTGFHLFGEITLLGAIHAWQHEIYPSVGDSSLERLNDLVEMQYIGLLDMNGKEIYDGDILKKMGVDYDSEEYKKWQDSGYEGEEPAHVELKRDVATLDVFRYWLKNESFGYEGEDLESPGDWIIIGNIYQNPELANPPRTT